jgi:Fe-S-cluster containining protein
MFHRRSSEAGSGTWGRMISCLGCDGVCCRNYAVPLTHADISRLIMGGGRASEFVDWLPVGSMFSTYPDVRLDGGYHYMVLKRGEDGVCVLSVRRGKAIRCGVHGKHPLLCRLYPYGPDGKIASDRCGMVEHSKALKELALQSRAELEDYSAKVSGWNRNAQKGRSPVDFIDYLMSFSA